MKRLKALNIISSVLFAAPVSIGAVNGSNLSADTVPEVIGTVTVTASRPVAKLTTGVPVQMLFSENLATLGVQGMADAVRRFAGVSVKDYGGLGGLKTVSVRNMGATHTGVSYDGVPVSNCQGGQIDIGRFSLDNVAMISLAVGEDVNPLQPARLYASAAVLNITSARPTFDIGKTSSFRAEVKGGSFGYVNPSVRYWQRLCDKLTLAVNGNFMRTDGNYPFLLVNGKNVTEERRNNSAVRSWNGEVNLYYTPSATSTLDLKGYYYYSKRGLPGSVIFYNPVSNETLWDKNGFAQVTYRNRFSEKWELQAAGKYNYGWNRDREFSNQFTGGMYEDVHTQNEYYLSATGLYRPLTGLTIALAQDGIINTLVSNIYECPMPKRYSSLTALNVRYSRGIANLNGTLVNTYITETVEIGDRPHDISHLNPSLSVSLRPISNREFYVRAMYKNTFRTASFNDLYYDRIGSRTLKPEKANEFDLGVTWSGKLFPAMEYISLTADGYYNNVDEKIVAFPTTYAWRMANYGKVRISGFDLTLATSFALPLDMTAVITGAYTYQKAIDITSEKNKNYKQQLPYTPRNSGNFSVTYITPWITVGYSLVAVGDRYYMSQNIPENLIDGYVEQTLTLSRSFSFKSCELGLRAEIQNIGNEQYDVIKFYPMPGRSWRLVANFKF